MRVLSVTRDTRQLTFSTYVSKVIVLIKNTQGVKICERLEKNVGFEENYTSLDIQRVDPP